MFYIILVTVLGSVFAGPLLRDVSDDWRIINGTNAEPGQYPYHVSLQNNGEHFCGATILTPTWCLTAAHCVVGKDVEKLSVLAGTVLLSKGGVRQAVQKYKVHEGYNSSNNWENDIALIQLQTPLEFNDLVQPLPQLQQGEETSPRTSVTVVGWGRTSTGGERPDNLQTVDILTFSDEECRSILNDIIHTSQICAGLPEGHKGECNGDSGGALVADGFQVGIVSWSYKPCTKPPRPSGVYTQVSYYIDWIKDNIE
ncbi:trypsin-1-like [Periplaneta americana]|uniref:trypsin-1-like n=1 Tax=Periplaneta americana TaxID=6978 RepID=UPI0037E70FB8